MGAGKRGSGGIQREVGGQFAGSGDVALADARTLHDPFIGGFDRARQLVIAENAGWEITATTEHDRTQ